LQKSKIASVRIFGETFKTEAIDDLDSHVNVRFAPEAVVRMSAWAIS